MPQLNKTICEINCTTDLIICDNPKNILIKGKQEEMFGN